MRASLVINCSISIVAIGQLWYFERFLPVLISRCLCFCNSCQCLQIQWKGVGNHINVFFASPVSCYLYLICFFRLSAGVQCTVISIHVVCVVLVVVIYSWSVYVRRLCCHLFRELAFQRQVFLLFFILYLMLFNLW